jgi:phosphoribosyl 1,2-cyclic phosphodiesterase
LAFRPVSLAHDREGSSGFVAEGFGRRIGYATDLGHVPAGLLEIFCGLDVLCIESNYDPPNAAGQPAAWFLKQRITGGRGHLSNQQAFDAVRQVFDRCQRRGLALPEHIVLLHRSRQCNCPHAPARPVRPRRPHRPAAHVGRAVQPNRMDTPAGQRSAARRTAPPGVGLTRSPFCLGAAGDAALA